MVSESCTRSVGASCADLPTLKNATFNVFGATSGTITKVCPEVTVRNRRGIGNMLIVVLGAAQLLGVWELFPPVVRRCECLEIMGVRCIFETRIKKNPGFARAHALWEQ